MLHAFRGESGLGSLRFGAQKVQPTGMVFLSNLKWLKLLTENTRHCQPVKKSLLNWQFYLAKGLLEQPDTHVPGTPTMHR